MKPAVDLVINTFERTYRDALKPGFFAEVERQNQFSFAGKVALINNVHDCEDARSRAQKLIEEGEISAFYFVNEYLDHALGATGLTRKDLGRITHYTDYLLIAVAIGDAPWLLYWDPEVRLKKATKWIEPAVELMGNDPRVLVANPNWDRPGLEHETIEMSGEFALGYGFSDQLFLVRRTELARPIYKRFCPASLRNPLAHFATPSFEMRVDAYMRSERRLRATYKEAVYMHPEYGGANYPPMNITERLRFYRNRLLLRVLRRIPTSNPCLKV